MRQRLALVAIEENDIAGLGLGLAQLEPEPDALDLSRDLQAPSAYAVAAATGSFFSQRLGELRWPDIDEFALFDLGDEAWDRPVRTVRDGALRATARKPAAQPRSSPAAGLHRARLDGLDAAAREIAAPKANGVLAHTEHLGDPRARPAIERQQYGARPIRLAAIT